VRQKHSGLLHLKGRVGHARHLELVAGPEHAAAHRHEDHDAPELVVPHVHDLGQRVRPGHRRRRRHALHDGVQNGVDALARARARPQHVGFFDSEHGFHLRQAGCRVARF